jgi:hypothetical protein
MFFGVFGTQLFVRLAPVDRARALDQEGACLFGPMLGRPLAEYVVLPPSVLEKEAEALSWVALGLAYALSLAVKKRARAPRGARGSETLHR